MDPDANLAEQRRIHQNPEPTEADLSRLAALTEALDAWLSDGGALPEAWTKRVHESPRPRLASPGLRMIPEPVPRAEFEALLTDRMMLREALRQVEISITTAKARTVEPVTRDNLWPEYTMMLLKRARREGNAALEQAVEAVLIRRDESRVDEVLAALNAEAGR
jgi:hypothetical protein